MDASDSQLLGLLCDEMPFTRAEAWELLRSAPRRYKVHYIEKRNGRGKRLIAQPTAEIKAVQRWVVARFIAKMPVHDAAMAYRPGRNIVDHAAPHAKNKYLLKVDFSDFFPSIRSRDFTRHAYKHLGVTTRLASELSLLLFRRDERKRLTLSIGAPSSPSVSNTLMFEFDSLLYDYCKSHDVTYTRYADDLALSTNVPRVLDATFAFIVELVKTIKYPRLELHPDKTVFTSKKFQRQLTGLILTSDGYVSLGREKKREIRAMADHFKKGILPPEKAARLKGYLAFAYSVDPEFARRTLKEIGEARHAELLTIGNIGLADGPPDPPWE